MLRQLCVYVSAHMCVESLHKIYLLLWLVGGKSLKLSDLENSTELDPFFVIVKVCTISFNINKPHHHSLV